MANPLRDEDKIYEKLRKEKITVHPDVWELLNHHIRNDVNVISLGLGEFYLEPAWILKAGSLVMKFLHKLSRQPGPAPYDLKPLISKLLSHTKDIDRFLKKLHSATTPEEKTND